jgi:putative flippase GtrA
MVKLSREIFLFAIVGGVGGLIIDAGIVQLLVESCGLESLSGARAFV